MLVAFLLAGASYYFVLEGYLPNAAIYGSRIALVIFLSWALARELQPDAPWAAFVAVVLTAAGVWYWPDPHLPLLFFILLILRLLTRTTGVTARGADIVLLLAFTGWLLYNGHLLAGVLATAAFWLSSRLPKGRSWHLYIAFLTGAATLALFGLNLHSLRPGELSIYVNMTIIALATGFALFSRKLKVIYSVDDAKNNPLYLSRVRSAQTTILLVITVFTLWYGDWYFNKLSPVWASFGGIFLFALFQPRPKNKDGTN
ncbi:MAG: hypothetical protein KY428_04045 [Bacteroidetes bacterium]|nr:hypothetical protein [Bacteroidota bacterium]